jgi:hypothetical protein
LTRTDIGRIEILHRSAAPDLIVTGELCWRESPWLGQQMQLDQLKRREFITLLGGAAVAWPLAVRGQQPAMPVIGFVHLTSLETNRENLTTFRRGLEDTGYIEGKNVAIEYRWAQGRNERFPALLAELVP